MTLYSILRRYSIIVTYSTALYMDYCGVWYVGSNAGLDVKPRCILPAYFAIVFISFLYVQGSLSCTSNYLRKSFVAFVVSGGRLPTVHVLGG